jgi:FAD:protein FMN transferase
MAYDRIFMKKVNHAALMIVICLALISCKQKQLIFDRISGYAQGSTYSIIFENGKKIDPSELKKQVDKIFHDFDKSLSVYDDSSLISKVNRNEDVLLDTFFLEVLKRSSEISSETKGAFDITVGPLVRAWGFGPDAHKNFDVTRLDSIMALIGYEKISVKNGRLIKKNPAMKIDVNAIAQGYSADVLYRYFSSLGLRNFLIEIGGEVRVRGAKYGDGWKIGIDKPEDNNDVPGAKLTAVIKLRNKALATSGSYRKFYIENGVKYSHEIDPETGYPAKNNLLSVSIIAYDCSTADGLATACMVMGVEKTKTFINNHSELEAYLIFSDEKGNYKTWATKRLSKNLSENNSD